MADAGCTPSTAPPPDGPACSGTKLFARPADPGARGPWPVGAHTSTIAGLTTEIWYPAKWGSDSCQSPTTYDIREHLPPADQKKIPDAENPIQVCDCVRDLPFDADHGPYPVVTFIHGTAAFRTQSLTFMTHWASRGFVVVSSDHPHIQLADMLTNLLGAGAADEQGDAVKVLAALASPTGDLQFLAGHLDMTRMGISGHSAGGQAIASIASRVTGIGVVAPMAAGGVDSIDGGLQPSSLVMSAANDGIAQPSSQTSGYANTPPRKRFVQVANAGHLAFSDLCSLGASNGGLLAIAEKYGVTNAGLFAPLASDGCPWQTGKSYTAITPQAGWAVVNFATSAALEEALMCDSSMTSALAGIRSAVPDVASYEEQL
jgi:predicted dienelactone hydrolase